MSSRVDMTMNYFDMKKTKDELQTIESFNYQWKNLPESDFLLSSEFWRRNVEFYILDELSMIDRYSLEGKTVLDIGAGQGRWSYGFVKLGCTVTATDVSYEGCEFIKKYVPEAEVIRSDLYNLPDLLGNRKFDIIWCWGVIHHVAEPHIAFDTMIRFMHNNSLIHLYIYSYHRDIKIKILRKILKSFSLEAKKKIISGWLKTGFLSGNLHGWFDALSPKINHEISETAVKRWFEKNGLVYTNYIPLWAKGSKDLFVTGVKSR